MPVVYGTLKNGKIVTKKQAVESAKDEVVRIVKEFENGSYPDLIPNVQNMVYWVSFNTGLDRDIVYNAIEDLTGTTVMRSLG